VAGFTPITASPQPYDRPSRIDARMPSTSSVGWFGWQRDDSRPGRPSVEFARTTTWHFAPTVIRSKFDISLAAAATISGVRPGAIARKVGPVVSTSSSHSRNWPTVRCDTARYA
jgi:hypothetical protein